MNSPSHPTAHEPIFRLPGVVLGSLAVLIGIHAIRMFLLPEDVDLEWLLAFAVVPARWAVAYGGTDAQDIISSLQNSGDMESMPLILAHYILADEGGKPWTGLTYALLHGSWTHVLLNSVWLAAFGTPLARRCGALRFLGLSAVAAFAGAVLYVLLHPWQVLPLIGASAAVSGMMGAAAWFMFAPPTFRHDGRLTEPHERRSESLQGLFTNRQVMLFLLVWIVINYFSDAFARPLGVTDVSIAWEAHLGGFFAGLALFPFIDPLRTRTPSRSA
ncbi:rhomboid family intramembrane serine protease [Microvirga flavescens]|uniref:rhomboid family intramembrane serine protease n=1 Tax=Microvirga flavescens TaxID=2249811 RepID=UPI000DDA11ED|nr:rhomboid family intramembrane serine protease [Microvirga flavescens]